MAEAPKKQYVGNGKKRSFANGGEVINFSINLDKIPAEYIKADKNGNGRYVRLVVQENYKGEPDKFGNSHNVTIDTWEPTQKGAAETTKNVTEYQEPKRNVSTIQDDLPF